MRDLSVSELLGFKIFLFLSMISVKKSWYLVSSQIARKNATLLGNGSVAGLTARLHSLYEESRFTTYWKESKQKYKTFIRKVEELMVTATEEELQFQRKRLQSYKTEIRAIRTERDTVRQKVLFQQITTGNILGVKV